MTGLRSVTTAFGLILVLVLTFSSVRCGDDDGGGWTAAKVCEEYCGQLITCGRALPAERPQCESSCTTSNQAEMDHSGPDCAQAIYDRHECVRELNCTEFEEWYISDTIGPIDYPCEGEDVTVLNECNAPY